VGAVNQRLPAIAAFACIAASLSLHSVVAGNGWLGTGIGAVIVVFAAGMLTRLRSLPAVAATTFLVLIAVVPLLTSATWAGRIGGLVLQAIASLLTYLASLLIYVNLVFAGRGSSYGWIIPSRASMTVLSRLAGDAFAEFKYSPPVMDLRGVSLVAGAGIGLVAITVDILAVRLRRPAVAGLPLLLLFSVPVASNVKSFGAAQMGCFAAGLGGYLALLSADGRDRLRMWGRLVTFRYTQAADESGAGPDTRDLAASGRRIGLAAICLAVAVPLVLPTLHAHDVFGTTDDGRSGGTLVVASNPLANTQKALSERPSSILTYTTTSPQPHQQYLQEYVLNYDEVDNAWNTVEPASSQAKQSTRLPFAIPGNPPASLTQTVDTEILLDAHASGEAVLPLPYAPAGLAVAGSDWQEASGTLMVFSTEQSPAGLRYTVTSHEADPTASQVGNQPAPNAISQEYGEYSGPDETRLQAIADKVTLGSDTLLQAALDLQNWFASSGAFTYTLQPHLPASRWLLKFLTTDRRGLCTQFAQAFAVLARLVGIPSRVAVGFTAGTYSKGEWHVTSADAHAWPELYFSGVGWLRFEPTPGGAEGQGTAYAPSYANGSTGPSGATGPSQAVLPPPTAPGQSAGKTPASSRIRKLGDPEPVGSGSIAAQQSSAGLAFAIGIPVLLLLLVSWPAVTRLATRRRRWLAAHSDAGLAHAAWRELSDDLTDYGLSGSPGETPRALTRRVAKAAHLSPAAAEAVIRIAAAEERARYSRETHPGRGLAADVVTVRRAVAASVPGRQRMRARFMPASTLEAANRLGQRAGDVLRWLEAPIPALRRQARSVGHRFN
jgi:transglutaminase-like putative cysteine protease